MIDKRGLNGTPVVPIADYIKNQDENNRRGPEEIKADLLNAASSFMQKTAIMSRCNLSFAQIEKYTRILKSKDLMSTEKNNGKQIFIITERGKRWLEQFRKLREIENGADLGNTSYIA